MARKAMINSFENGCLNVLDFETIVKSLRLAWLGWLLYIDEDAGWKRYLRFLIKPFGVISFFILIMNPENTT